MKFTAVGDILPQKRLPEDYQGFSELRDFIMQGDARFFNFESTINREGECFASQFSGGTYIRCNPEVYEDMLSFGFNMTNLNQNHAMDFSYEGFYSSYEALRDSGIVHAGVGMNLGEAAAPRYLETKAGRVGLVSVNTSFSAPMMAGEQTGRIMGRPGINGITVQRKLVMEKKDFEAVQAAVEKTNVNGYNRILINEGYALPPEEGVYEFMGVTVLCGEESGVQYEPSAKDVSRVISAIREAKQSADYVFVSLHNHQVVGEDKSEVPKFLEELCHRFIDEGADAIVGHGPHLLRAIEIYKERPIFYSLGDFLVQLYDVPFAPAEFYAKYGVDNREPAIELLKKRSHNFTRGLMADVQMLEAVIPYWETDESGRLTKLVLKPTLASVGNGKALEGLPQPNSGDGFFERLKELCAKHGTVLQREGDLFKVVI